MSRQYVISFDQSDAVAHVLVGGKGANLEQLAQAGFNVPHGFSVTTEAYADFVRQNGLDEKIRHGLGRFKYDNFQELERFTAELRNEIENASLPAGIVETILKGYRALGESAYVAVRSSGTAEDLAEASFAGQHDTYLSIRGDDAVLDAVRRCWASLWTARATAYRNRNKIDSAKVAIAVVIQKMVDSEVAGVLFTGNPLTTATDEMVINASWGLGEGVVSGVTQPDEFVIDSDSLGVREKRLGEKTVQIVRDVANGLGVVIQDVPERDRARFCLSDSEVVALGELGRRVTQHYGGLPQDIEWGMAGGTLYLLQSRPITGVAFSWDADLEYWQKPAGENHLWTRSWADELWNGGCTPLFYSWRAKSLADMYEYNKKLYGIDDAAFSGPYFQYYKGVPYYNTVADEAMAIALLPQKYRGAMLAHIFPTRREAVLNAPFSLDPVVQMVSRSLRLDTPNNPLRYVTLHEASIREKTRETDGLADEKLRELSDQELISYARERTQAEDDYVLSICSIPFFFMPVLMSALSYMVSEWYNGSNAALFSDLVTGTPRKTVTVKENLRLLELAREIRRSPALSDCFRNHEGADFFSALKESEQGRVWLQKYHVFLKAHPHRGPADRDFYHPRRVEDPRIDYRSLQALLSVDEHYDPEQQEHAVNQRRHDARAEAIENMGKHSFGAIKVEIFKELHDYIMEFSVFRDDQRDFEDRALFCLRRVYLEMSRRLRSRGLLETERDFYFLGIEELYALLQGRANMPLLKAKIAARMANFDAVNRKEVVRPKYLRNYQPGEVVLDDEDDGSGVLRGNGTSRGTVTGVAKVVKSLHEIGRIHPGEILVCNSTDPGWTPAFLVVRGLVLETGGLLAHGSCLAREYGLPAVQLSSAMQRIPDGATITINGDTGEVILVDVSDSRTSGSPDSLVARTLLTE